jgi:hypothetical protein
MFALKERSRNDEEANKWINDAMLCKIFRCNPKELQEMDWDVVEYYKEVYTKVSKDNPMIMFM